MGGPLLYAEEVEDQLVTKIGHYMDALLAGKVSPPMIVLLAGVRVHGAAVSRSSIPDSMPRFPHRHGEMFFPAVTLDDYGRLEDYRRALKPIFDALWNRWLPRFAELWVRWPVEKAIVGSAATENRDRAMGHKLTLSLCSPENSPFPEFTSRSRLCSVDFRV
jgi:hypothetical protein